MIGEINMQNKTTTYLNSLLENGCFTVDSAFERLSKDYGIKITNYNNCLYVLNYDQINSPKTNDIVKECRSLVLGVDFIGDLNEPEFYVDSYSFDRFFNAGEVKFPHKINKMTAHEKMDGSIVTLWYDDKYEGKWIYRTRSMIMPESNINGWDRTWKDLIESSIGNYENVSEHFSYIFEVTGEENRVVVRYEKDKPATLLAVRSNITGKYLLDEEVDIIAEYNGWDRPRRFKFETLADVAEAASELPNLEEGYVMYYKGCPIGKVKNPAYVAAHHLRGEGLNPKRCLDLVILGEIDEYLAVFPEDSERLERHKDLLDRALQTINDAYEKHKHLENQKDFALAVVPLCGGRIGSCLFSMRGKGITAKEAFDAISTKSKYDLLGYLL